MKVILTEKVPSLGNIGELVKVSNGHARNYLIPKRLAVYADESNKKQLENQKRRLNKKIEEQKNHALELKKQIDKFVIELTKKVGGSGKLFGTVTNTELAKELSAKGIDVERRLITIDPAIKFLGTSEVKVKLFSDVEAIFKVKVIMDPKQALEEKAKREALEKKLASKKKTTEQKSTEESSEVENKKDKDEEKQD